MAASSLESRSHKAMPGEQQTDDGYYPSPMATRCGTIVAQLVRPIREPHGASRTAFDRPRRRHHRIRGRRRHGHQGAGRHRRPRPPDGGRPDGDHGRLQEAGSPLDPGIAAPATRRSSTPPARAPPLNTERRASPPNATDEPYTVAPGQPVPLVAVARASAAAPTTTRACSCATRTTTSRTSRCNGVGFDWPIGYDGPRAVLRQGRAAHRRDRPARRAPQRARRHLPDARAVQAARASRLASAARSSASRPPARARP